MFPRDLIIYQNRLFWLYKRLKTSQIKPEGITLIKEYWNCDIVVKNVNQNDDSYLFLREIPEAEIIE